MDFNDTPEEAEYRAKVKTWLGDNAPKSRRGEATHDENPDGLEASKAWQKKKAGAGYAAITWPTEWGGQGGKTWQNMIFSQEESKAAPGLSGPFSIGLGMCIPTLMTAGNDADKARFVGPAVKGDEWVINGQKVWTSGAHYSDFGLLLTRTDRDVPKHKGMTMFWIDMHDPAVEVRPIHQMSGASNFNEVYFTDLRVKDSQRVGAVGDGWKVAIVTLMNERLSVGGGAGGSNTGQVMKLAENIQTLAGPASKDAGLREKIADWFVQAEGLKYTTYRTMTALSRGQTPGPENSIAKIVAANVMQEMANAAMDLEDQYGILVGANAPLAGAFQTALMGAPGLRIAGGTDEILRNIIAERVLGMPPDIRVDKDVAFKDIPTGR